MSFLNAFIARSSTNDGWFFAGLTTSFPNITVSGSTCLSDLLPCKNSNAPACKVFHVPLADSSQAVEVDLKSITTVSDGLKDQVMVFQYQGGFHAVDHSCPHSSFPLSRATPFDIEDFGVRLSAGIMCPKHDWSFDMFHGHGDRGSYRLNIWKVELRPVARAESEGGVNEGEEEREVWVRRKQRIG